MCSFFCLEHYSASSFYSSSKLICHFLRKAFPDLLKACTPFWATAAQDSSWLRTQALKQVSRVQVQFWHVPAVWPGSSVSTSVRWRSSHKVVQTKMTSRDVNYYYCSSKHYISFWELTMSIINLPVCMFIIQPSLFSIMGSPWGQWSCLSYPFLYSTQIAQCLERRRCSRNSWMRNVLKWAFPGTKPWGDPGSPGTSQGAGQMALLCISFSPW